MDLTKLVLESIPERIRQEREDLRLSPKEEER